jgi:hypothetical protein
MLHLPLRLLALLPAATPSLKREVAVAVRKGFLPWRSGGSDLAVAVTRADASAARSPSRSCSSLAALPWSEESPSAAFAAASSSWSSTSLIGYYQSPDRPSVLKGFSLP